MRLVVLVLGSTLLMAGCGVSAASTPTPTPTSSTSSSSEAMRFSSPPAMTVSQNKRYVATLNTSDGSFTIELLPRLAPQTVNNFVFLARHHFYNHIQFIRVIQDFMIQTGDPTETGTGGPGYSIPDELHPKYHLHYGLGTVAMANEGVPDTGGSQFFIVTGPQAATLHYSYTIFGYVSHGMDVVRKLAATPVGQNVATGETSQPLSPVYLKSVSIAVLPPLHGHAKAPTGR